ncbi:MAG TPA: outer membrane protein assembly factor BamD [Thiotrichales bacterium]|nr:outer membrane protein assembly factor BamD [Thiotrichales bacterium]
MRFFRYTLPALMLAALLQGCAGHDKDENAGMSAKELYEEAQAAIDAAEFETAVKNLESLEARYPFDPYAKQAQLDIAYAYYKFDELDKANSAANRFVRLHPRSEHLDYVYYLKGLINFTRGSGLLDTWFPRKPYKHDPAVLENAYNDFATLVRRYPDSLYAGDAYQRMIFLRNEMAHKEIDVAEFYIRRGTWLSSAKRAKAVIQRYPESVWVKRALEIMKESYEHLQLNDLAADIQRVIDYNDFTNYSTVIDPSLKKTGPASL